MNIDSTYFNDNKVTNEKIELLLEKLKEDQTSMQNGEFGKLLQMSEIPIMTDPFYTMYKGSASRKLQYSDDHFYYENAPHAHIHFVPPDLTGIDYDAFEVGGILSEDAFNEFLVNATSSQISEGKMFSALNTLPAELLGISIEIRKLLLQETGYLNISGLPKKNRVSSRDKVYNIGIPLLSNFVIADSYNVNEPSLSVSEAGENIVGARQVIPKHTMASKVGNQLTIEYQEVASGRYGNAIITKLHQAWILYMELVRNGTMNPSAKYTAGRKYKWDDKLGIVSAPGVSKDKKSFRRALNYMGSIYYFKLGPNGKDIVYWEKSTGVFPTGVSYGSFNGGAKDMVKTNITYQSQHTEQMNIETLIEFNELNLRYNTRIETSTGRDGVAIDTLYPNDVCSYITHKNLPGDMRFELHVGPDDLSKLYEGAEKKLVLPDQVIDYSTNNLRATVLSDYKEYLSEEENVGDPGNAKDLDGLTLDKWLN